MDESLEREGYEVSNSLSNCPNCFARLTEYEEPSFPYRILIKCSVCDTVVKEIYE